MKSIYLDYASTTPLDPDVLSAMKPYLDTDFANPSSFHRAGQYSRTAVDEARSRVAKVLGAKQHEIIFTPSATAANNLAIRGFVDFCLTSQVLKKKGARFHVITSEFEHESVLETVKALEKKNMIEATYLKPTHDGFIRPQDVAKALKENTVLVSIMYVNNEIGTIQKIAEISDIVRDFRSTKHEIRNTKQIQNSKIKAQNDKKISDFGFRTSDLEAAFPLLHTDAVQALQFLDTDVGRLGVDMLTLSAHKIYGPKGVGVLYKKGDVELEPFIYGGGQEFGFMSGTENVAGIVGCAKAFDIAVLDRRLASIKARGLRDYLWKKLRKEVGDLELNGSLENRLPNNLNILVKKEIDSDVLRVGLSEAGIAVSFGSACLSNVVQPSHVLLSIGLNYEETKKSFRISLGRQTKEKDLDIFVSVLRKLFEV